MAVYVDQLVPVAESCTWPWKQACHMYADHVDELHQFAKGIGLRRSWFQDHRNLPHYDLTAGMRALALKAGAEPTGRRHLVEHMQGIRRKR